MSLRNDYALLLAGSPQHELDMGRELLADAGIPCVLDRASPATAALDVIGIRPLPFGDLYVPREAVEQATAVLDAAWGTAWRGE